MKVISKKTLVPQTTYVEIDKEVYISEDQYEFDSKEECESHELEIHNKNTCK